MSDDEKLLPLATAVERATGQRHSPSTYHRWRQRGISGVKLETVRCGGRRLCSIESVRRFLREVTAATDGVPSPSPRTPRHRKRDIERAERELADL